MKRLALLVSLVLGLSLRAGAQQNATLTAVGSSGCTSTTTGCLVQSVNQNQGGATFTITANAGGNTIVFEASGDGAQTWVALNVTPSNGTTAVTSSTSTGTWQANIAGYTHIRMRMSVQNSGNSTVQITPSVASARAGGGGGGGTIGGSIAANQVAFGSGANAIQGSAAFTYDGTTLIAPNGQFLGGGSCANNTAVGLLALAANGAGDCGVGINTAVGYHALTLNSSGVHNVAVGPALEANTTGGSNTAVGEGALNAISTTSSSTAVGANALASATGAANSAFGVGACLSVTTGTSNTCIGGDVNAAADTNELILGGASSNKGAGSNTTTIGTASTTDTWIGGNTGKSSLHAASTVFVGATSGSATIGVAAVAGTPNQINLPTATGSSGQFLRTDGANPQQLSWVTPVSSVSGTTNQIDVATGTTTPVVSIDSALQLPGTLTVPQNGALSQAAITLTGTPVTGGTGTTTFPLYYYNAGTAPTTWSTSGTLLGFNAPSGFAGNFMDVHLNGGASLFSVNSLGTLVAGFRIVGASVFANAGSLGFGSSAGASSTTFQAPSNGVLSVTNAAQTGFTRFVLGPDTTAFPALCSSTGTTPVLNIDVGAACTTGTFIKTAQTLQVITADVTCGTGGTLDPCTSFTTITGLSRALPTVSTTWSFSCDLIVSQATASAADQIGVQTATNASTNLAASGVAYTAAAVSTAAAFTGASSTTAQSIVTFTPGATGTKLPVHVSGTVEGTSTSGTTFNLQVLTGAAGDLLTVYRGSACWLW